MAKTSCRRVPRLRLAIAAAGAVLALRAPAAATTIIAKDLPALCREADVVFAGAVTSVVSQWAGKAGGGIETLVTFAVSEPLFGVDKPEVTLRFAGGQVGTVREEIAGVPHFTAGERTVIFARRERSVSPIVGFSQGAFRVVDGSGGPVVLSAEGAPVAGVREGRLTFGAAAEGAPAAMPLPAFLDTVKGLLAQRKGNGS